MFTFCFTNRSVPILVLQAPSEEKLSLKHHDDLRTAKLHWQRGKEVKLLTFTNTDRKTLTTLP